MTVTTPVGGGVVRRFRTLRWVVLAVVVIAGVSAVSTYFTASRPGGRMDPDATSPAGAHAIVALLEDHGVEVDRAGDVAAVQRAAGPDALLLVTQTKYLIGEDALRELAALPVDVLLVEPVSRTQEALAPKVETADDTSFGGEPDCDMPEATRAGSAQLGASPTYQRADDSGPAVTSCYQGAVVRYRDAGRTVTVAGTADFMTNEGLLDEGNAALAMNLAGSHPRLIWYTAERVEGESDASASIFDLIPDRVVWIVLQLCLVVLFLALWRGRRIGPLVAEDLPVVVRASETVEGRGRLYRSRRARDRAATALRTAALSRMTPRLGLGPQSPPAAVVEAIAGRVGNGAAAVGYALYGPDPADDAALLELSRLLDDIERQVATS